MARNDFRKYGTPIRVDGGIEARTKRGAIGRSWWSKELIGAWSRSPTKAG